MSRKKRRAVKEAMGYEARPPACYNCRFYVPAIYPRKPGHSYVPMRCASGEFVVEAHGICDEWQGKDGSTLE